MTRSPQAPADEYFGALHMSAIAIRMRIDVLGRRYNERTASDDDLMHDAADVDTALKAWLARYPNDTWAAPTSFHLAELYQDVQTPAARRKARDAFAYVGSHYATSKYGHLARLRLARGFPPLHDESPIVATPAPGGAGSATPNASALPLASAVPSASALPGPHASSTASPATAQPSAPPSPGKRLPSSKPT
ncbi:MAG: hypothetical protein NVSMB64_05420 [Candidatus Velthaea sp.]